MKNLLNTQNLVAILAILLSVLGVIIISVSNLPIETIKKALDPLSPDGNLEIIKAQSLLLLRFAGLIFLVSSFLLFITRKWWGNLFSSSLDCLMEFAQDARTFLANLIYQNPVFSWSLLLIFIVGLIIRLTFISQPIREDEARTVITFASENRSLLDIISWYGWPNNHLFHTLLVHYLIIFLGDEEWIVRLPALIAGLLLIPMTYLTGYILYNKYTGLLAASLVAGSSFLIEFSTNARGYTLVCLNFLAILILAKLFLKRNSIAIGILLIILGAIGLYTIPTFLYPLGITITWIVLSIIFKNTNFIEKKSLARALFIYLILMAIITFILYLPIILRGDLNALIGNPWIEKKSWSYFLSNLPGHLQETWVAWNIDIPTYFSLFLGICFFVSIAFHRNIATDKIPLPIPTILFLSLMLSYQRVIPFVRVWSFLLPLYFVLSSAGVSYLLSRIKIKETQNSLMFSSLSVFLALGLSLNVFRSQSVYYSEQTGTMLDSEKITLFLKDQLSSNRGVLSIAPVSNPLRYYFKQHNISLDYINEDLPNKEQLFVVVKKSSNIPLTTHFKKNYLSLEEYHEPKLIREFIDGEVYLVKKTQSVTAK